MPKYERFAWMEAGNEDFIGEAIWYDSACVNQNSESNSTDFALNVTTDIQYIRDVVTASEPERFLKMGGCYLLIIYRGPITIFTLTQVVEWCTLF